MDIVLYRNSQFEIVPSSSMKDLPLHAYSIKRDRFYKVLTDYLEDVYTYDVNCYVIGDRIFYNYIEDFRRVSYDYTFGYEDDTVPTEEIINTENIIFYLGDNLPSDEKIIEYYNQNKDLNLISVNLCVKDKEGNYKLLNKDYDFICQDEVNIGDFVEDTDNRFAIVTNNHKDKISYVLNKALKYQYYYHWMYKAKEANIENYKVIIERLNK